LVALSGDHRSGNAASTLAQYAPILGLQEILGKHEGDTSPQMSTNISVSRAMTVQVDPEKAHRSRLGIAYAIAGVLTLIQIVYGSNYYILSQANRALSPKHAWLKPSGVIGLHLGMVAFALFLIVYVYPLRKIWPWLGRQGNPATLAGFSRPDGDCCAGPRHISLFLQVFRACRSSLLDHGDRRAERIRGTLHLRTDSAQFRFRRGVTQDAKELSDKLTEQLSSLGILSPKDVETLVHFPSSREFEQMSVLTALWKMMVFDMEYPMRVWRLPAKDALVASENSVAGGAQAHPQCETGKCHCDCPGTGRAYQEDHVPFEDTPDAASLAHDPPAV